MKLNTLVFNIHPNNSRASRSGLSVRYKPVGPCDGQPTLGDVDNVTAELLAKYLRSDTNPHVRDVVFLNNEDRRACNKAHAWNATIDVDGQCWRQTHRDNLGVFDFTYWAKKHG